MLVTPLRQIEIAILAIWAVVLVAAFAFGQLSADHTRHSIRPLLMVTSALLVLLALLWWLAPVSGARSVPQSVSLLIFLGMLFGFLGDLIMADILRTPDRVIFGIGSFGIGHGCYIAAFLLALRAIHAQSGRVNWIVMASLVLLGIVLWTGLVRNPDKPLPLNLAALVYTLLICIMVAFAISLALAVPRLWYLALGALLFLASDAILGNQIFRDHQWFLVSDVVWVTYIVGQLLIVRSNAVLKCL
ncbi:MAG: lysoplasmalogenase [Acidobacteriota bacterium]